MPGSEIALRIADTFTGSLAKLTGEEQKAVLPRSRCAGVEYSTQRPIRRAR